MVPAEAKEAISHHCRPEMTHAHVTRRRWKHAIHRSRGGREREQQYIHIYDITRKILEITTSLSAQPGEQIWETSVRPSMTKSASEAVDGSTHMRQPS